MAARNHRATFSRDRRKGGYLVRVEGPHSNRFTDRTVPVTMRNGTEKDVTLRGLVWSGNDNESGKPVSLYEFEKTIEDTDDDVLF